MKNKYSDLFCPIPFEFVYIDHKGNMNPHCAGLINFGFGDLKERDFLDVWNSGTARSLRESILDGSFKYCLEHGCKPLLEGRLPMIEKINNLVHKKIIANGSTVLKKGPAALNFGYDPTCNLKCRSCRNENSFVGYREKTAELIHQKAVGEHLRDARILVLSAMGDPIASRLYRAFLQDRGPSEYPRLKLRIVTNGLLLTPAMWSNMSAWHGAVDCLSISIDAATEETYKINRGGDFNALMKNLEFAGELRRDGKVKELCIDFVVQANNYREMKSFVELGKRLGCDWVSFKHIENWGTYTEEEFREVAVHEPSHAGHSEFLEILADPVMKDPVVWLRNLSPFISEEDERGGSLKLCDFEVYNLILNDMEYDFFRRKLSLTGQLDRQIRNILNELKDDIAEICSRNIPGENITPLEFIAKEVSQPLEMEEGCIIKNFEEYAILDNEALKKAESRRFIEIQQLLDGTRQNILRQLIRIKPLIYINTGHFPLKAKLLLILKEEVRTSI